METLEKKVKHTPGPWIVEQNSSFNQIGDRQIIRAEIPSKNLWDQICEVTMPTGLMGGSNEANAKLIAAAPELLRELNEALLIVVVAKREEFIKSGAAYEEAQRMADEHHRVVSIRKAILKATE